MTDPAITRLRELHRRGGWQWFGTESRDGEPVLQGVRTWPNSDFADAIAVYSATDAHANRTGTEGPVWLRSGTVVDVVDQLLELPGPHAPLTPRLVLGVRAPRTTDL